MNITVYSTPTCPYCIMAKDYLKEKNIPFEDVDVSADREKAREMIQKSGQRGVPVIDAAGTSLLKTAMKKLQLSARAYDRILKVSRTIADLEGSKTIEIPHLAEAIHFRSLDREEWAG